jgi:hypothetical protein
MFIVFLDRCHDWWAKQFQKSMNLHPGGKLEVKEMVDCDDGTYGCPAINSISCPRDGRLLRISLLELLSRVSASLDIST